MGTSYDNANPSCDYCQAGYGVCTECNGCFGEHCTCDPCQHGKARSEECSFCGRENPKTVEEIFNVDR